MKRKNLTTEQIRATNTLGLIFRLNCLHATCKRRGEGAGIPITDIWEAAVIVDVLRRRLGRLGIFYMEMRDEK